MNGITPVFALLIFVAIIGFFIYMFWRDQKQKQELRQHGVTIQAKVTDRVHEVQHNTDENTHTTTTTDTYTISYEYVVNGVTYSGRDNVSLNIFDVLREGQPVEVVYLPENPAEVRLASSL